jgi:hypothetical protein
MLKDLKEIREALSSLANKYEFMAYSSAGNAALQDEMKSHAIDAGVSKQAITKLDAVIAKLESPELVEKVAGAIRVTPDVFVPVNHSLRQEYESISGSNKMAQAALDIIKGQ